MNNSGSLTGKVSLVTGGSGDIGRAIAKRLASEGSNILITYSGAEDRAETTLSEIIQAGGVAQSFKLDQRNPEDIENVIAYVQNEFARPIVFVSKMFKSVTNLELKRRSQNKRTVEEKVEFVLNVLVGGESTEDSLYDDFSNVIPSPPEPPEFVLPIPDPIENQILIKPLQYQGLEDFFNPKILKFKQTMR